MFGRGLYSGAQVAVFKVAKARTRIIAGKEKRCQIAKNKSLGYMARIILKNLDSFEYLCETV